MESTSGNTAASINSLLKRYYKHCQLNKSVADNSRSLFNNVRDIEIIRKFNNSVDAALVPQDIKIFLGAVLYPTDVKFVNQRKTCCYWIQGILLTDNVDLIDESFNDSLSHQYYLIAECLEYGAVKCLKHLLAKKLTLVETDYQRIYQAEFKHYSPGAYEVFKNFLENNYPQFKF